MELTPEERRRIFEDEKIRIEARAQTEKAQTEQLLQARHAHRRGSRAKRIVLFAGLAVALLTILAWRVRLALANDGLVAMVKQAEAYVGASPSDDDWKLISGKAFVKGERDGDHRAAALLYIRSLRYAVTNERAGWTYRDLGLQIEKLDLIDAAEYCHRLAVGLGPGDSFSRQCLADVLVKQKKYAEAETIYRELLLRASTADDKSYLNLSLARLLETTGRRSEADNYNKEFQKWIREVK